MINRFDAQARTHVLFADDLHDAFRFLKANPQNWGHASTSNGAGQSWDLKVGWEGAMKLAEKGWTEGAVDFANGIAALPPNEAEPEYTYDVAGYMPDVALYCAGEPMHMMNEGHPQGRKPIVHIIINNWILAMVNAHDQRNYGLALAAMIQQIEATGRQCEIDLLYVGSGYSPGTPAVGWKVKRAGDVLDYSALAFSVAHPASFRRLGFAMLERLPAKWRQMGYGYNGRLTKAHAHLINGDDTAFLLDGIGSAAGACSTVEGALAYAAQQINKAAGEPIVELTA